MRAQLTKNAVIVPAGAKGGFYLKQPPAGREALKAEVERQYVRYIGGAARAHRQPRRRRGRPSRGRARARRARTPTSSSRPTRARRRSPTPPTAVAEERGFWLGDAFASGGSAGYDHKALGITARGAWESVKRHFRELDLDPRPTSSRSSASATCAATCSATGCCCRASCAWSPPTTTGTSSSTPTPTPPSSFEERKRLFELPGLLLGRLRPREDLRGRRRVAAHAPRAIPLSEQARAALGIEDEALPPTEVIRAILRAPVDLLWNGGIGTVVKASTESDDDAQDRASEAIRVDAERPARPRRRRGRQPRPHPPRADRVLAARRTGQRRLHRQLRRRRLLRPRGQPEDPARPRRARAAT